MTYKEDFEKIDELFTYLKKNTPNQLNAFGMLNIVDNESTLSPKLKQAVVLGIAIKAQCKPCILLHTKKALAKGLTKEEILEIAWLAVFMGGGPSLMYITYVKEVLDNEI